MTVRPCVLGWRDGASWPVTGAQLRRIGFTDHALKRFAARAKLGTQDRHVVEPIVRDLILREGRVVTRRPRWSRSRTTADLYVQVGEWMLFIAVRDERRAGRYAVVTVVNGPEGISWRVARRRGLVSTRAPTVARRAWLGALASMLRGRRSRRARR